MGKPKAPDPWETASAQGQWNAFTAQQQQAMNMVGQDTPWGSMAYDQTGTQTIIGPDGKPVQVPSYTATTTLSPSQQAIFDQGQTAQLNLAGLAADQSEFMREYLSTPFSYNPGQHEGWALGLYDSLNADSQNAGMESLRTRLANQGIAEGSAAYQSAMRDFTSGNQTARDRFLLDSYGQGLNTALLERNQPINELSAFMSGSQVSMPQFQNTPQTGVAGVDYTGLVNNQYQQQMNNWQAGMGGLFGLGGALLGSPLMSDRRLKTDIKPVGKLDNGLTVYSYRYVWGGPQHIGLMADEVKSVHPDAVIKQEGGYDAVDYLKAVEAA